MARTHISLNADAINTEIAELENALRGGRYAEASKRLSDIATKPLLDQMHFGDEFGRWLDDMRRQIELRLTMRFSVGTAGASLPLGCLGG